MHKEWEMRAMDYMAIHPDPTLFKCHGQHIKGFLIKVQLNFHAHKIAVFYACYKRYTQKKTESCV